MKEMVAEEVADAKKQIKGFVDTAKDKIADTAKKTDDLAHENPWQVAGIAAGVGAIAGLVLGVLINRKRD